LLSRVGNRIATEEKREQEKNMNNCQFTGNLARDPELRSTNGGKKVCSFTVAVNGRTKDAKAYFAQFECWEQTAEFVEKWFKKGDGIVVAKSEAKLDEWEKDGEKRSKTVYIARDVEFPPGGRRKEGDEDREVSGVDFGKAVAESKAAKAGAGAGKGGKAKAAKDEDDDGGLPF